MELKYVKGLSDKRITDLNKLGITSAEKLIRHFPRNYLDLTSIAPIRYAFPNEYCFTKAFEKKLKISPIEYRKKYSKLT